MKFSDVGHGPTLEWDGLWLTLPRPTGLINLKPLRTKTRPAAPRSAQDSGNAAVGVGPKCLCPLPTLRACGGGLRRWRQVACCGFVNHKDINALGHRLLMAQQHQAVLGW